MDGEQIVGVRIAQREDRAVCTWSIRDQAHTTTDVSQRAWKVSSADPKKGPEGHLLDAQCAVTRFHIKKSKPDDTFASTR